MLITVDHLAARLNDPNWVIFDCRHDLMDFAKGERLYRETHIPGAHFASVERDLSGPKSGTNGRHPLPPPAAFADFLARHGATNHSTIVAYDDIGGMYAARLWWMTRWIGLQGGVLLDGGFPKWTASGNTTSADIPPSRQGHVHASVDNTLVWSVADVTRHLRDSEYSLVDARTAERHRGENEMIDPVAGRIPNSLNRFYKANLNADTTFRPAADLKRELAALIGQARPENVVHYCGSGVTACANAFAMDYAGLSGSKIYAGSWSEWIADPARPVARGTP